MTAPSQQTVVNVPRSAWPIGGLAFLFFAFCTCTWTCDRNLVVGPHEIGCAPRSTAP